MIVSKAEAGCLEVRKVWKILKSKIFHKTDWWGRCHQSALSQDWI